MTDQAQWGRVGKYVQARMRTLGLTNENVASAAGVSRATVAEIRKGVPRDRPPSTLAPICRALGWSPDSIELTLGGAEPVESPASAPVAPDIEAHFAAIDARFDRLEQMVKRILPREPAG